MISTRLSSDAQNVAFLVDNFCERVPGARQAVVVSADGLLMAMSGGMSRDVGDRFAAVASGLIGLAFGAAVPFNGGRVNEVIIEMERAFIFVTGISDGSCLAVLSEINADPGLIAYEMARMVEQVGRVLTPELRNELQNALAR